MRWPKEKDKQWPPIRYTENLGFSNTTPLKKAGNGKDFQLH